MTKKNPEASVDRTIKSDTGVRGKLQVNHEARPAPIQEAGWTGRVPQRPGQVPAVDGLGGSLAEAPRDSVEGMDPHSIAVAAGLGSSEGAVVPDSTRDAHSDESR
jgi:hypothetical protein